MFVFIWYALPLWLPFVTALMAWELWGMYVRARFAASKPKILLEVRLPQEINKSPLAMEIVLTALYVTSRESTFIDRNFKGQSRPEFSLELVSIGGKIHFYIRTEKDFKQIIESQIYSQYQNIEIQEVPDYTQGIVYQPGVNQMFGCEFVKVAPDPLPIKTYIDYGLDKDPKEEYKIDPMTPTLEFLGAIKKEEQVWIQIILRAHKSEYRVKKDGKTVKVDWKYVADEQKRKFLESLKDKKNPDSPARRATKGENEIIESIERNVAKTPFDVGIRTIYFAQPQAAFTGITRSGLLGTVRQYNSARLNGFKPENTTSFDYPWQDFRESRLNGKKRTILKAYKERNYFGMSKRRTIVMNTEELATMYHFPGGVATTPNFTRIMSKKGEAPSNLPT